MKKNKIIEKLGLEGSISEKHAEDIKEILEIEFTNQKKEIREECVKVVEKEIITDKQIIAETPIYKFARKLSNAKLSNIKTKFKK